MDLYRFANHISILINDHDLGVGSIGIFYTRTPQRTGTVTNPVISPCVRTSDDPGTGMKHQAAALPAQRFKRMLDTRMII